MIFFFFSSRRRHTRLTCDWSSDVCSSDLPSRQIEEKYLTYLVETKRGQVHSGLLVSKDATKVVLKDATNKQIEIPAGDVELLVPQQKSLMPDLLLRDLTTEQVADLTAFLSSLK